MLNIIEDEIYIYINCTFSESVYVQAKWKSDLINSSISHVYIHSFEDLIDDNKGYYFNSYHDLFKYFQEKRAEKNLKYLCE